MTEFIRYMGGADRQEYTPQDLIKVGVEIDEDLSFPRGVGVEVDDLVADALVDNESRYFADFERTHDPDMGPYDGWEYKELTAELSRRNEERDDDTKLKPESRSGEHIIAALTEDDTNAGVSVETDSITESGTTQQFGTGGTPGQMGNTGAGTSTATGGAGGTPPVMGTP